MKPLTTSIYTFEKLIEGGYQYVDKTVQLFSLINEPFALYFLARPRRFGKSLLVSTLRAIFEGRRNLFKGLAIDGLDYDWKTYPVIHLDMGDRKGAAAEELESSLLYEVRKNATRLGVSLSESDPAAALRELIDLLSAQGEKVVILVDEYDKPLLNHLGAKSAEEIQRTLKSFYAVIKTTESAQRFVLMTGVSKFSQVSVFSDLNNLTDLSMDARAATLLGYTQAELEVNFPEYIAALAEKERKDLASILFEIREWYNGYRFEENAETVYNPVSVMKCFQNRKFKNYWFETGTPSFLVRMLEKEHLDLSLMTVEETALSAFEPDLLKPLPLLLQTGYLTIVDTDWFGDARLYTLGFPNREVERAFSTFLVSEYAKVSLPELSRELIDIKAAFEAGELEMLFEHLKVFFASIPYDITLQSEKYYQSILYALFRLLGVAVEVEVRTNRGRLDAVVKTAQRIFIFEFKLQGTAREALDQIRSKGYVEPYLKDGRKLLCIGVAFDKPSRNIGEWLVEEI